jgi:hypothetical protein
MIRILVSILILGSIYTGKVIDDNSKLYKVIDNRKDTILKKDNDIKELKKVIKKKNLHLEILRDRVIFYKNK